MALRFPLLIPPQMFDDALSDLFDRPVEPIRGRDGRMAIRYLAVDIRDDGDALVLSAAVPGLKPEQLQISIEGQTLTLSAEIERQEKVDEPDYVLRERTYGGFRRIIALPVKVDADATTANIEDGVLTLRMPKAPEATPKRIEVAAAKA
jgi:HSP20 family protein